MVESSFVAEPLTTPPSTASTITERWTPATRIAFRFLFAYFSAYVLTTQMLGGLVTAPGFGFPPLEELQPIRSIYRWAAVHIFRITQPLVVSGSGSGDKTFNWVGAFCLVMFAAATALVWTLVDRRRPHYRSLNKWFRVFLRFALGTTMLTYGMAKAFPLQMPYPTLSRLVEPYGRFSPMGVLWYSIGAAPAYERFAGSMELTAAVLLFVPALSTLGAAVAFADTVQILMLNLTYDVPVKLFAFHLLVLSLVLLAPEMTRILNLFVFDRAAPPSSQPPLAAGRGARRLLAIGQIALGMYFLGLNYVGARHAWKQVGPSAAKPPLYGIWDVEKITIDGVARPPLLTDASRWRRLILQRPTFVTAQGMDDDFTTYSSQIDIGRKSLVLKQGAADKDWTGRFSYGQPDAEHLELDGELTGHHIAAELRLVDTRNFLLVNRGFHWIQEYPFNR